MAPPKAALHAGKPPKTALGANRQEIYWIGAAEFRILAAMAAGKIFNAAEGKVAFGKSTFGCPVPENVWVCEPEPTNVAMGIFT